jgi:hypothetical protein
MALMITAASINQQMRDRINHFWGRVPRQCQVCGNFNWSVEENLAQLHVLASMPHMQPSVFPLVVITCQVCGNTILLNALKLGWMPDSMAGGE